MSRYYFHVDYNGHISERSNADLADPADAWDQAIITCGQMLKDLRGGLSPSSPWKMAVSDETGTPIFEMQFSAKAFVDL